FVFFVFFFFSSRRRHTISKRDWSSDVCSSDLIIIGIFSTFGFLIYGNILGNLVFGSEEAGHYVYLFAILCPFMYAAQTLSSILRSEEHTSELQSRFDLVCRLLLEKKNMIFD